MLVAAALPMSNNGSHRNVTADPPEGGKKFGKSNLDFSGKRPINGSQRDVTADPPVEEKISRKAICFLLDSEITN